MIFSQIDRNTLSNLCTLVKLSEENKQYLEGIILTGQHMGVPTEETLALITEWEESDAIELNSREEKERFVNECFSYFEKIDPPKSEKILYNHVVKKLGLKKLSLN